MFTKLLKYEWKSNAGLFGILSAAVLGISALGGLILRVLIHHGEELDGIAGFGLASLLFFVFLSLIGYSVAVWVLLLVRFYKNKFTDEGYLTFTLPVTSHEIVLSSVVNMILWSLISVLVLGVSGGLIFWIADFGVIPEEIKEIFALVFEDVGAIFPDGYWVLTAIATVVSGIGSIIIPITCLTLGATLAKKHKILAAFGVYYGLSVAIGVVESVLTVAVSIGTLMSGDEMTLMYTTSLTTILLQLGLAVGGYFLTTHLMKNSLNLN